MRIVPMTTQEARSLSLALAETLAGRLCHDLAGMVGTLMGAVELASEEPSMRDEALPMAVEAATALGDRLRLMRAAWGGEGFPMDGSDLRALATGLPRGRRVLVSLDGLAPTRNFPASTARLLLNLLILAVESLAGDGTVTLVDASDGRLVLSIDGPRAAWPSGFAGQLADAAVAK
jgi:histidine phosphotransferase ChpT